MRLVIYEHESAVCLGCAQSNQVFELGRFGDDLPASINELISDWETWRDRVADRFDKATGLPLDSVTLLPPVLRPEKIFCIGRNYAEHAAEMNASVDDVPVVFSKYSSALIGHEAKIVLPTLSEQVDCEAELVVVIGRQGKDIDATEAPKYIFGYCCGNDVTARDWQKGKPGGQWLLGKSFDTFAPLGPQLVTADEILDAGQLKIASRINGHPWQQADTSQLIFPINFLISHLSKFCTLRPGDLIFTGTPGGVGAARNPPVFLKSGDIVEVEIESVGVLRNTVADS